MNESNVLPQYVRVWQTWDLVCPQTQDKMSTMTTTGPRYTNTNIGGTTVVDVDTSSSLDASAESMRQKVQRARIERRMSIASLASEVMCTAETLAAFERGDGVLSSDVRARIFKLLKLH